jgi:hypothetical protein
LREPDLQIKRDGKPYLNRWWLLPKDKYPINIYLHQFLSSDPDKELHDHPWWSVSFLLKGELEELYNGGAYGNAIWRKILLLLPYLRRSRHSHRMLLKSESAWTIFITGKEWRPWGFWTEDGWVESSEFLGE